MRRGLRLPRATLTPVVLLAAAAAATAGPLPIAPAPDIQLGRAGAFETTYEAAVATTSAATFTVPVEVPAHGRLLTAVAVPPRSWTFDQHDTARPVRIRVTFDDGAESRTLYERTIDLVGNDDDQRWYEIGRDLADLAGRAGELHFEARATGDEGPPTHVVWAHPLVASCPRPAPSLLLITIDALRADHLGNAGYARATTPFLDAFAARSTRFTNAFAAAPKTIPSIPQILTGLYFPHLRTERGLATLLPSERFVQTRAVVNNPYVQAWLAAAQPGFHAVTAGDLDARAITSAALRMLTAAGPCPTALYLHYLDPHTPYASPPRYARRYIDPTAETSIGLTFADVTGVWQQRYGPADHRRIIDLYDGAIAWTDRQLGRLFRGLERRGRLADTIVVVTADHGEELWDHGAFFHGQSLYDEQLHVPLIVHLPGVGHGRTVDAMASTVDVLPTIAAAIGAAAPDDVDGEDLGSLAAGRGGSERDARSVFATVTYTEPRSPERHAVRTSTHKLVHNVTDGSLEVYALAEDPHETHDLGAAAPEARPLLAALGTLRARLAARGYHLRVAARGADTVRYAVRITGTTPLPLIASDRISLERTDTVIHGPRSATLTLQGDVAAGDEDEIRFDVGAAAGALDVRVLVERAPLPPSSLRLGAGAVPATGPVDITDAALAGAPTNAPGASPEDTGPISVALWRTDDGGQDVPPLDDDARERLRQLGYLE